MFWSNNKALEQCERAPLRRRQRDMTPPETPASKRGDDVDEDIVDEETVDDHLDKERATAG